jgi:hypothetical protein
MKYKGLLSALVLALAVLFAYGPANAQVVEKVKDAAGKTKDVTVDAAEKTKDVTVDTAKKTKVIVTDGLEKAADKTGDAASATAKAGKSTTKTIGNHAVTVTDNVVAEVKKDGKWFTVTTWDGTKWVSKKTWIETKKVAGATKDAVQ